MSETNEARWYVVHTYSGHEKKVQANLKKIVENRGMEDLILDVVVPVEKVDEVKDGKKREGKERKIFPSYVMVKFFKTPETWFVVRNIKGVTGFVGGSTEPLPLTQEEAEDMGLEKRTVITDYEVGDRVRVLAGSFANQEGIVKKIDFSKEQVSVVFEVFGGRETQIDLNFEDVTRVR